MSEHYYTERPTSGRDPRRIEAVLRGERFTFATDAGVFSKREVDYGSQLLIETMDIPRTASVLDMGCGYGPIGLAAARLADQGTVTMVDMNERAVELAGANARLNRIANVRILQSDGFARLGEERFTHILSNPPIRAGKEIVYRMFDESVLHLTEQGELWIVIQKKQGAPSALNKLESLFAVVEEKAKDKGYRIFRAMKSEASGES